MKTISLIASIVVCLALTAPVLAHDPFIEEEDWGSFDAPLMVADSSISYALYGYLDEGDVDVFQLDFAEAEMLLRAEVLTPVCGEHYASFYPQFAILADRDSVTEPLDVALPFEIADDLAVLYNTIEDSMNIDAEATSEPTPEVRSTFVEPFGGTEFYDGPSIDLMTPVAGSYYVAVFNADGLAGDYALATGYKEQFNSPADQMLRNVGAIRSGEWLHRRCDLPPDDPDAVIEHDHDH